MIEAMVRRRIPTPHMKFELFVSQNTTKTLKFTMNDSQKHVIVDWGDGKCTVGNNTRYWAPSHTYETLSENKTYKIVIIGPVTSLSTDQSAFINIDITNNSYLSSLSVRKAGLNTINLSKSYNLKQLYLDGNNLTSIDLSNLKKLQLLYLAGHYGSNKITKLDISNNSNLTTLFCYMDTLTEIVGLDGIDRTITNFQITTAAHRKINANFDLSKLRIANKGQFTLATTGNVTINACINRDRLFDVGYSGSKSWNNWQIYANELKVIFDDGFETTDFREYFHHLASIVKESDLYKYPQCNSWRLPISGNRRDYYDDYYILKYDGYYGITWSNFEANSFGGASSLGVFTQKITLPKGVAGDFVFKVSYKDDAKFFFGYTVSSSYGVIDSGHPRFKYENGELTCSGDLEEIQTNIVDGNIETTFKVTLPKLSYFPTGYAIFTLGIFESSYPDESNPYVNKVLGIELIEQ